MTLRLREVRLDEIEPARELALRCGSQCKGRLRHELSLLAWPDGSAGKAMTGEEAAQPVAGALTFETADGMLVIEVAAGGPIDDAQLGGLIDKCLLKVQSFGARRLRVHVLDQPMGNRMWSERTVA